MIKSQAAKWKEGGQVPKGTDQSHLSFKRKVPSKQYRLPKRPKVTLEPVVGLKAEGTKTVATAKHGVGKGFMKGPSTSKEKPLVLLHKDSKYALEKLSSIIIDADYKDLGNHSTEAMGETGLFGIAQVILPIHFPFVLTFQFKTKFIFIFQAMVMVKGLMGRCLNHETTLEHVRAKADLTEGESSQLKA